VGQEIELKLTLDDADLARVPTLPLFAQVDFGAKPPQKLKATYFDSATSVLRQNGIVLRLRDEDGRRVQTLKSKKHFGSLAAGRAEYEFTVRKNRKSVDLKKLPDAIEDDVSRLLDGSKLEPVFKTNVERTLGLMKTEGGAQIELALDRGSIHAGTQTISVSEMELELKKGHPSNLYQTALQMVGTVPVRIGMRSKSERGFALAYGLVPHAVKVDTVHLSKSTTVEEALEQVLRHCLSHIVANEPALVDANDAEALHQMRVALRRLRAALEVFAPVLNAEMSKDLAAKARNLSIVLGAARDLDVFRTEILKPLKELSIDDVTALDEVARVAQVDAWARAMDAVRAPEFTRSCLSFALYIEEQSWRQAAEGSAAKEMRLAMPARQFAAAALNKRWKKTKRLARNMDQLSLAERHALRKQLKSMRYAVGFFSSLYGAKKVSRQLSYLVQLQQMFGSLNDLAMAEQIVGILIKDEKRACQTENVLLAKGVGRVLGWHGAKADETWAEAIAIWGKLKNAPLFWR
jgi:inorganic triphosphatase YgiF